MAKTVVLYWPGGYKIKPRTQSVEYPDDHTLHYDTNQSCLRILAPGGEPVAAFRCPIFTVPDVVTDGIPEPIENAWWVAE